MMQVTVQRQPANRQGPDIVDPLLVSEPVAVERGRNEIDANCTPRVQVVMETVPLAGVRINRVVEVQDMAAPAWRGLLTGIAIRMSRDGEQVSASMSLTVEREAA